MAYLVTRFVLAERVQFFLFCAVAEWLRRSLRTIRARRPGSNLTTAIGPVTARTRLAQPATFSAMANRVPASAGVMAGTSPVSGGR